MTKITVTYDDETHVVVPRNPTDEMEEEMRDTCGNFNKYCAAITAAPPFVSLPNDDALNAARYLWLRDKANGVNSCAPLVFWADSQGLPMRHTSGKGLDEELDFVLSVKS